MAVKEKVRSAAEKIEKTGIKKRKGFLYFINMAGDVMCCRMQMGRGKPRSKPELVQKVGIKRVVGYLYFIDKQGDISRIKMANFEARTQPKSRRK